MTDNLPPKTIKIGAINYRVERSMYAISDEPDARHKTIGEITYDTALIYLSADQDPQIEVVTIWHEVLHGLLQHAGIDDEKHDEGLINLISYGLVQVIKENPALIEYTQQQPVV